MLRRFLSSCDQKTNSQPISNEKTQRNKERKQVCQKSMSMSESSWQDIVYMQTNPPGRQLRRPLSSRCEWRDQGWNDRSSAPVATRTSSRSADRKRAAERLRGPARQRRTQPGVFALRRQRRAKAPVGGSQKLEDLRQGSCSRRRHFQSGSRSRSSLESAERHFGGLDKFQRHPLADLHKTQGGGR